MTTSHITLVAFFIYFFITIKPFGIYGFSIKLIPIDRFDTMLFPRNLTLEERYQKIFKISLSHVHRLESIVSSSSMDPKEPIEHRSDALQPMVGKGTLFYYLTTLSAGAHQYTAYYVVDTGAVDTWMQCEGCRHCFFLREGNFDKSRSKSYQPLPCDHPLCVPRLCENNVCMYNQTYIGSSYTRGQLGLDTLFFNDKGSIKGFPNTVFGCGLDNYQFSWEKSGQNNNIAGVFGLGLGKRSIFMQYVNETKNRISYCLPSPYSHGAHTYLHFGDDAQITRRPGVMTTRLIPHVTRYAVKLNGISINGKRLNINPKVFQMRPDHTGGFILDSGCPHTALVPAAYNVVKKEIIQYFHRHYSWDPLPPQQGELELCYNMPNHNFTAPSMTYHFEGADLFLPERNVFLFWNASFCSMVMAINDPGPSLLGALQQTNYRFLFDFNAFTASFVPESCQ